VKLTLRECCTKKNVRHIGDIRRDDCACGVQGQRKEEKQSWGGETLNVRVECAMLG